MTLLMGDDTTVANLPDTFDAYLGYMNGLYVTAPELKARFPAKPLVILSVYGDATGADGVDIEPQNYNAMQGVAALVNIKTPRPVLYADIDTPNYNMAAVRQELAAAHINRADVRLLSAHYTYQKHICGPNSCGVIDIDMDGTQYTDQAIGNNGSEIDASLLLNNFFAAIPTTIEDDMRIINVDRATVPAGQLWPGQFKLTCCGIQHLESAEYIALTNAKITEVTVSYKDWQALAGVPTA